MIPALDSVTHEQLHETLEHARLVKDLGGAGAPGAAYAIAEIAPLLVLELRDARREVDNERSTREALEAKLAEVKADLSEWVKAFGHLHAAVAPRALINVDDPAAMARDAVAALATVVNPAAEDTGARDAVAGARRSA